MKTVLHRIAKYGTVAFGLAALFALPARAQSQIQLSLTPSAQSIYVGDSADVRLQISGLGNTLLAGWWVEIAYDQTILSTPSVDIESPFSPGTSGSGLTGTLFFAFDVADDTASNFPTGDGLITLATFSFAGLVAGISPVDWADGGINISLSDDGAVSLPFNLGQAVEIEVLARPNGVPDTSVTLPLVAVVGLLFAFRRHGRRAV